MDNVNYNWAIGVGLAALGSFVSNLGVTLQKLHHIQCAQAVTSTATDGASSTKTSNHRHDYYKQSLWRIGLALVVVGSVADFVALSFAPQSLVAPLGSLTLVSNVIFAPLLLKEKITTRDLIATITIVSGSTIAVAYASHDDVIYGNLTTALLHSYLSCNGARLIELCYDE
jgi:drug/metabolite transporter (DMT)-like permease